MTRRPERSLPPGCFEALYARDPDPWRFATSAYERAKYDATLAALPRPRYAAALEVGCSIGVLTARLAERCERLLAVDVVEAALAEARRRGRDLPQVRFARRRLPGETPEGRFDLVLLSEVAYCWDADDLARAAGYLADALAPGGDLLLVRWIKATNYPLSGDDAAEGLIRAVAPFAAATASARTESYRLDLLRRTKGSGSNWTGPLRLDQDLVAIGRPRGR